MGQFCDPSRNTGRGINDTIALKEIIMEYDIIVHIPVKVDAESSDEAATKAVDQAREVLNKYVVFEKDFSDDELVVTVL